MFLVSWMVSGRVMIGILVSFLIGRWVYELWCYYVFIIREVKVLIKRICLLFILLWKVIYIRKFWIFILLYEDYFMDLGFFWYIVDMIFLKLGYIFFLELWFILRLWKDKLNNFYVYVSIVRMNKVVIYVCV